MSPNELARHRAFPIGEWLSEILEGLGEAPLEELFRRADRLEDAISQPDINAAAQAILDELAARDVAKLSREEVAGRAGSLYLGAMLYRCSWATVDWTITLRATELARAVLRPHLGPHTALAWRSAGLYYSKNSDYVLANAYFEEAVDRLARWGRNTEVQCSYQALREQHAEFGSALTSPVCPQAVLAEMHEETHEQILLGQTGTAARTVEHALTQWDDKKATNPREPRLVFYRLYKSALQAIEYGEGSTARLEGLHTYARRSLERIARPIWKRRPGVMTARSHILAVPLCRVLCDLQARHPVHINNWDAAIREHRDGFVHHYRAVVAPLVDEDGRPVPADTNHLRELAQLRLTFALVFEDGEIEVASEALDDKVGADACLASRRVDIAAHARWLRAARDQNGRSADGNIIASVVCSSYAAALEGLPAGLTYPDFVLKYPWLPRASSPGNPAVTEVMERMAPGLGAARARDAALP